MLRNLVTAAVAAWLLAPVWAQAGELELAVLSELNFARTQPQAYADGLEAYLDRFSGLEVDDPDTGPVLTNEGAAAVTEAIIFLRTQAPLPPLSANHVLAKAALDHAGDQAGGRLGHAGSDGSSTGERILRYGQWHGGIAENISYGHGIPQTVVRQLIIDDGVPTRGHRGNIFDTGFRIVGVGCGPHSGWGTVCVMDFAGAVTEPSVATTLTQR